MYSCLSKVLNPAILEKILKVYIKFHVCQENNKLLFIIPLRVTVAGNKRYNNRYDDINGYRTVYRNHFVIHAGLKVIKQNPTTNTFFQ